MSIPMLVVLKNGAVAASTVGVQPKAAILELRNAKRVLHLTVLDFRYNGSNIILKLII